MEYRHTPVLLAEVTQHLRLTPGSIVVDCTLGGAGHAKQLASLIAPTGVLVGIDQDDAALEAAAVTLRLGQQTPAKTILIKGNFAELDALLVEAQVPYADGVLMDLGVSSPQLDVVDRGFSFRESAPLDMRMDPGRQTLTAAEVIAAYDEADLARIFREYGEERWASRIAAFVTSARARRPIATTGDLVEVIKAAIPASARRSGGHPAKRTFQALRIEVNDELGALQRGLEAAIRWLSPQGRIAVISYHSLEDRIVKRVFASGAQGCTCPPDLPVCTCDDTPVVRVVTRKAILPSADEIERNPRARSAKLRVAEKL
jgi:16S rRNA (cytosine1402-N4)-methyltransferase